MIIFISFSTLIITCATENRAYAFDQPKKSSFGVIVLTNWGVFKWNIITLQKIII